MKIYTKAGDKYFCKGQQVRAMNDLRPGRVGCVQKLQDFYILTGKIPVIFGNESDSYYPEELKILTLEKKSKGGVIKGMPRFYKFLLYGILVLAAWRFTFPFVDLSLTFLETLVKKI